jgi:hypothetical protein
MGVGVVGCADREEHGRVGRGGDERVARPWIRAALAVAGMVGCWGTAGLHSPPHKSSISGARVVDPNQPYLTLPSP